MKEINLARSIAAKRREKGVTQEELARYIGVSKASVSKWETGQSYPDITFLPLLAAYFAVSIDELMDYQPQMTEEDIAKLYRKLSRDFAEKPFDGVMARCRAAVKKYYACFPLLFQIGALLVNHSMLPGDPEKSATVLTEAKELFIRVKRESDDPELIKTALCMESLCLLQLGDPDQVLDLLEDTGSKQVMSGEALLATAYQMVGKTVEAKCVLQKNAYESVLQLLGTLSSYMELCTDDPAVFREAARRAFAVAELFRLHTLHPATLMNLQLAAAKGFLLHGEKDEALRQLEDYGKLVCSDIYPLTLHGDDFFTGLDAWFAGFDMGPYPPRDEKTIRQSMLGAVECAPHFAALQTEPAFQALIKKLKKNSKEE